MSTYSRNQRARPFQCHAWVALLVIIGITGCGTPREELGPVSGRVTLDGKPVTGAIVLFQDDARGIHMQAHLDADGRFEISMAAGYGLPLGTYAVSVRPTAKAPEQGQGPVDPSSLADTPRAERPRIPRKYHLAKTSGLSITVARGGGEFSFEMASDADS